MMAATGNRLPIPYLALLLAGLLLRLFLIVVQPLHGSTNPNRVAYNDEASHWNHALILRDTGRPGVQRSGVRETGSLAQGEVEYSQPPLYYWFSSLVLRVIGSGPYSITILRLISLLFWFGALHLLFYQTPFEGARLPILIGGTLLGAGWISSSTINNDSLFALTIAGLYFFAVQAGKKDFSLLRLINLGLLFAVAIWTKLAALALGPMVLAIAYVAGPKPKGIARVMLVGGIALWATLPLWLQRTVLLGSPLNIGPAESGELPPFSLIETLKGTLYSLVMPYMELYWHPAVKIAMLAFAFLLFAAVCLGAIRFREIHQYIRETGASTATLLFMIGALGSVAAWFYYAIRYQQSEARLLLPAAPALAIAFGWQLYMYRGWVKRAFVGLVIVVLSLPLVALGVG